jgi:hypothetical protein
MRFLVTMIFAAVMGKVASRDTRPRMVDEFSLA